MTGHARAARTPTLAGIKRRYAVAAAAFVGVAMLRTDHGEYAWAAVFALAAVANAWLALPPLRNHAKAAQSQGASLDRPGAKSARPVVRTEAAKRGRTWRVLAAAATGLAVVLLTVVPAFGVVAGALALLALHQAHRSRYTAAA